MNWVAFRAPSVRAKGILVKPNLLAAEPLERGVDTHPEVVRAVLKELLAIGRTRWWVTALVSGVWRG